MPQFASTVDKIPDVTSQIEMMIKKRKIYDPFHLGLKKLDMNEK